MELLLSILNNEQKLNIAAMKEDGLIDLHFGLGMRNWGQRKLKFQMFPEFNFSYFCPSYLSYSVICR
ncbi:hypothetical protein AU255_06460 [Methyloprofundus sedimenti]|uniref:Uncharacterized protein n=1 Tax=Methyloprofundus sedimenti TaxID=1420851 RepID=A0A1V8M7F8_9GAMM|nr:hypothetical protein AU255_06460 [Methyloprofundus sedimenti]